jgi:hypothetical protein
MATGTAGASARDVMMPVKQVITRTINFGDTGIASGVVIGTLPIGAVIQNWRATVETLFNAGSTNPISIGTTATGVEIAATASITSGTAGVYTGSPATTTGWSKTTANTPIYTSYIQTGTAASTGKAHLVIEYVSMVSTNTDQVT